MKYTKIIIALIALSISFGSCTKEEDETIIKQKQAPELANPDGSASYVLIEENDNIVKNGKTDI